MDNDQWWSDDFLSDFSDTSGDSDPFPGHCHMDDDAFADLLNYWHDEADALNYWYDEADAIPGDDEDSDLICYDPYIGDSDDDDDDEPTISLLCTEKFYDPWLEDDLNSSSSIFVVNDDGWANN